MEELAQLTYDLQNLMAATEIATLFLDRDLRILRFTPKISDIINVRMTDRGRPLSDLTHRLGYDELEEDARRVLEDLAPIQHEVQDDQGRWYLSWILPHRSSADRIEGVVMNFIDINARKEAEEALRRQKRELWELNQSLERLVTERTAELEDRNKELQNFAYIASHDLREPLRKIQAYCWKRQGMHLGKKVANTLNVYSLRLHAWMDY